LSSCDAGVTWKEVWSVYFEVNFGVRQRPVLSPCLFNIYLDDVANLNNITTNDHLLSERELQFLDMSISVKKSSCIRIGHRHNGTFASITMCHGQRYISTVNGFCQFCNKL